MKRLSHHSFLGALIPALLVACSIYGPLNNPIDPSSPNYMGTPANLMLPSGSNTTTPVLEWGLQLQGSQAAPAVKYHIQVATDSEFKTIVVDDSSTSTQYTVTKALSNNTEYYWRVAAETASGQQGEWSQVGSFTVLVTGLAYTLTVESGGNGTVAINGGSSSSSASIQVSSGLTTNLSATASSGYVFTNWTVVSGNPTIGNVNSAVTTVMLNGGNAAVQANFQTGTSSSISYSPNSLGFSASQGGSNPPSQTLIVENSGGGTLSWTASSNQSWVSLSQSIGTTSSGSFSTISVSTSISGLSAGTYNATITIAASGASNTPQSVPVSLSVYSSGGGTLAWSDSFESYAVGSFPSTWTPVANATDSSTNYVDNSLASNGSQSLKLYGQVGGCWGSITDRPLDVTPPYEVDLDVYNGTEATSGCHPDRGVVGLRQGTNWTNPSRQLIDFDQAGNITDMNGNILTTYSSGQWYQVGIVYQLSGSNVNATYTINGIAYPTVSAPAQSAESSLTNLELTAQEGSVWFDNVQVYQH